MTLNDYPKGTGMSSAVKARIIKMGNSRGIRIPKPLLEQVGLASDIEVEVEALSDQLVIRPVARRPRQGWEKQFKTMATRGDDRLLDGELVSGSKWDEKQWEW